MTRTYETSHPWLKFEIDLRRAQPGLWLMLGEATSKVEHIRGVPLRPAVADELHRVYLAKGAHATTSIEGNSLTEEQVRALVENRELALPRSQQYLELEVQNMLDAFNTIAADLRANGPIEPTLEMICDWNRMALKGLELPPEVVPGELRTHAVVAGPYRGAPAEDLEYLMGRLLDWLRDGFAHPEDQPDQRMTHAILKAICAHVYFELIHPFGDGNGRTGRLLEFAILVASDVPFPAAHLLSNHYNQTRSHYYIRLGTVSRSGGDLLEFIEYAVEGFVDGLRSQIGRIQQEQLDVAWENYVYSVLDDLPDQLAHRGARLVLAMSRPPFDEGMVFPLPLLASLTPEIEQIYSQMNPRTLRRDLQRLIDRRLIEQHPEGYSAAKDVVQAFLPVSVRSEPRIVRED